MRKKFIQNLMNIDKSHEKEQDYKSRIFMNCNYKQHQVICITERILIVDRGRISAVALQFFCGLAENRICIFCLVCYSTAVTLERLHKRHSLSIYQHMYTHLKIEYKENISSSIMSQWFPDYKRGATTFIYWSTRNKIRTIQH